MRHDRQRIWRGTAAVTAATLAALLGGGFAAAKIPCGYDVEIVAQDCGIFHEDTEGLGIAPSGLVVGRFPDCQDGKPFYHAFLWPPGGPMQMVPLLAGGPDVYSMELFGANDAGQSVGTLKEFDGYNFEAFMLDKGKVIALGVLPGAIASEALAVNAHGVAVGWSGFSSRVSRNAVLWQPDGTIFNLAPGLGTPMSEALDVNAYNQVTGWMGTTSIQAHAYIWHSDKVIELPLLPEPGAYSTTGRAINDLGNVCGSGIVPMPGIDYGLAYAYIDGQANSLGTLPGFQGSRATDINNLNQIVGYCIGGGFTAVLWEGSDIYRLSDFIDPELDLHIAEANAISDSGVISGTAVDPIGNGYAVRLTPRPRADFDCDGDIGGTDLGTLLGQWGNCSRNLSCTGDLNSDGIVNGFDLAMLLADWG